MLTEGMFIDDRYEIVGKIGAAECRMSIRQKTIH